MKKKLNKFMSLLLAAVFAISTVFTAFADTEMVGVADAEEVVAAEAAEITEASATEEAEVTEAAEEAAEEAMLGATVYDIKCAYGDVTWILRAEEISRGESSINRVLDHVGIPRRKANDAVAKAFLSSETYFSFDKTSGSDIGEWKIKCGSGTPTDTTLNVTVDGKDYAIDLSKYPPEKNQRGDFQIKIDQNNKNLAFGEKGAYELKCKNADYTKLEYFWSFTEKPETGIAKFVSKEGNQCVVEPTGTTSGCIDLFCEVFFTDKNGDEWRSRVSNRVTIGDDVPTGIYLDYGDSNKLEIGESRKITVRMGAYEEFTLEDVTSVEWDDSALRFATLSRKVTEKDFERTMTANKAGEGSIQVTVTYQTQSMTKPNTWTVGDGFWAEQPREDNPPFQLYTDNTNRNLAKDEVGEYEVKQTDDTVVVKKYEWSFEENVAKGLAGFVSAQDAKAVKVKATGVDGYINLRCRISYERNGKTYEADRGTIVTTGKDVEAGPWLNIGEGPAVLEIGEPKIVTIEPGAYVCTDLSEIWKVDIRSYDSNVLNVEKISNTEYKLTGLKTGKGNTSVNFDVYYDEEEPDRRWGIGRGFTVQNAQEDKPPFELYIEDESRNLKKDETGKYEIKTLDGAVTVKSYEWSIREEYGKGLASFVTPADVNHVEIKATGADGYFDLGCRIEYERDGKTLEAHFGNIITTGKDVEPGPWLDIENYYIPAGGKVTAEIKPGAYICTSADQMVRIEMGSYDKSVIDVKQITKTKYEITGLKAGRAHVYFEVYFDEKNPERRWGIGNGFEVQDVATMLPADTWVPAGTNLEKVGEVRFRNDFVPGEGDVDLGTVDETRRIHAYFYRNEDTMVISVPEGCVVYFNEDSSGMFSKFPNLRTVNIESHGVHFVDTSRVKNMDGMFAGLKKLEYIDLFINTKNAVSWKDMFKDCTGLGRLNIHTGLFRRFEVLPSNVTYTCVETGAKEISNLELAKQPEGVYLYTLIGKATEEKKPVDTNDTKTEGTGDASVVIEQIKKNKKAEAVSTGLVSVVKRTDLVEAAGLELNQVKNIELSTSVKLIGLTVDKDGNANIAKKITFEIKPEAVIEKNDGNKVPAKVENDMLNGEKIKVVVPVPDTEKNAVEIVHVSQGMPNETFTVYIDKSQGSGNYFIEFEITHFSTFEMTFVDKHDDPDPVPPYEPSYSSTGSTVLFTGTWNKPVSNGTWKKDANGIWHYATTMTFRNTWGYIVNPYAGEGQNKADWFWFDSNGNMLSGWQLINGKWYYLNPTVGSGVFGACLIGPGKTPDGYEIDASGAWIGK